MTSERHSSRFRVGDVTEAKLGYILRDQWSAVESYISPISTVLITLLVVLFAVRFVRQWRGRRREEMSEQPGE